MSSDNANTFHGWAITAKGKLTKRLGERDNWYLFKFIHEPIC